MRNMSFSLTTEQVRTKMKDVTRRLGWAFLRPGDHLMAVKKCQGLKKGDRICRIHEIVVISVTPEPLNSIITDPIRDNARGPETAREGFPELSPAEFVELFCKSMQIKPTDFVNRIEFRHVRDGEQ